MTTLIDAMLETARVICDVQDGTATGGSATTLTDTNMDQVDGYYTEGVLWVLSGTYDGACKIVRAHGGNTLTFDALAGAIIATDTYAVSPPKFPRHVLKSSVLTALRNKKVVQHDVSLTTIANTESYSLPTGVSNVLRVDIASNTSAPYVYEPHLEWKEVDGTIYLGNYWIPDAGFIIRLTYKGTHGDIAETGSVDDWVNINWLKWASAVNCWRWYVQKHGKDDPTAVDMLNEAKQNEDMYNTPMVSIARDPYIAGW